MHLRADLRRYKASRWCLGINQLKSPVKEGEEVGEREKERTVKELAFSVERGIEEGIYSNNSNNSERGWYFQNDMPSTSAMALADEAAAQYQAEEYEAAEGGLM